MGTLSPTLCILVVTILVGGCLFGTCMANEELKTSARQRRVWGGGSGWGRGRFGRRRHDASPTRGQSVPPPPPAEGQGVPPTPDTSQGGEGWWPAPAQGEGAPGYNFSRGSDCPFSHKNSTRHPGPNNIVVGGSNNWNFGFNYTDWALKNGPFYLNDVLVFKFNAPANGAPGHSVYLFEDFWSYLKCDFRRAKQIATTTQGGGKGFKFKLTKWQPHYFACGEHNGIHCNLGMMKFFVMPIFRYQN